MKGNISSKQTGCTKLMVRIAMKGAHVNVGREGSSDEAGGTVEGNSKKPAM